MREPRVPLGVVLEEQPLPVARPVQVPDRAVEVVGDEDAVEKIQRVISGMDDLKEAMRRFGVAFKVERPAAPGDEEDEALRLAEIGEQLGVAPENLGEFVATVIDLRKATAVA